MFASRSARWLRGRFRCLPLAVIILCLSGCLVIFRIRVLNNSTCSIVKKALLMNAYTSYRANEHEGILPVNWHIGVRDTLAEKQPNKVGSLARGLPSDRGLNFAPVDRRGNEMRSRFRRTRDDRQHLQIEPVDYVFDCSNIHLIRLRGEVGHGVTKTTHFGEYNGHQVAVKMVSPIQEDVTACLTDMYASKAATAKLADGETSRCYVFPRMKLMKETLLLDQLKHPNIVKLLGYCIRGDEMEAMDLSEHGVILVEEFASRLLLCCLDTLPWQEMLRHAKDLANLLKYLEYSPMGSLIVRDFKESHFLIADSKIKLTDLDDIDSVEPTCSSSRDKGEGRCDFGLPCQMGRCIGHNAKTNLVNVRDFFFVRLLHPGSFPDEIVKYIVEINDRLHDVSISARELYVAFMKLMKMTEK